MWTRPVKKKWPIFKRNMKNFILVSILCVICSCASNKSIKMAKEFCNAIQIQDKEVILQLYPESLQSDSLVLPTSDLKFNAKTVEGKSVVELTDGCYLVMEKDSDGGLKIVDSKGLFFFSPERIDFGSRTGWIDAGMTDQEIAERFNDSGFIYFLVGKFKEGLSVKSVNSSYDGLVCDRFWTTTIVNNTGVDIDGSDYSISFKPEVSFDTPFPKQSSGEDIKNGASLSFTYPASMEEGKVVGIIEFSISDTDILSKYVKPTGNEYEQYKNALQGGDSAVE